jgi:CRP-like cAMP-binding protein
MERRSMMTVQALSSHDVFSFLQPEQLNAISEVSEVVTLSAGETVFRSGDRAQYLYAVLDGVVSLRLPREGNISLLIEELGKGTLFGSCVCFDLAEYTLTAVCATDAQLLRISAEGLKRVMDEDLATGYPVQRLIARTYFKRYVDTMKRLQTVAESLALNAG